MSTCDRCAAPWPRAGLTEVAGKPVCPPCLGKQAEREMMHPHRAESVGTEVVGREESLPKELNIWIPGYIPGPNQMNAMSLRERMAWKKQLRERAFLHAKNAAARARVSPFCGITTIEFEVRRARLLDPDNLVASLKHVIDGLTRALLPFGDGPKTPYLWVPPVQIATPKADEGLFVLLKALED